MLQMVPVVVDRGQQLKVDLQESCRKAVAAGTADLTQVPRLRLAVRASAEG